MTRDAFKTDRTLEGVALLAELPGHERRALEARCRWRCYEPKKQIIDCDSDTREVFFVVRGRVRVVNFSASGREISFADIEAGGCFGELAAIDDGRRSASVMALDETLVASLAPRLFIDLISSHPGVAISFLRQFALMLRQANQRIMDLSILGAHNRVHTELLRLARANGSGDDTAVISPIPTHADIASRVSTARETTARVLSDLTKQGVLRREGDSLVIVRLSKLINMVDHMEFGCRRA